MKAPSLLVLLTSTLLLAATAEAQNGPERKGNWIEATDVIVVVPKSRTMIAAYSVRLDKWDRIELPVPLPVDHHVVVSSSIAAFHTPEAVYAFTAGGGRWAKHAFKDGTSKTPVLSSHHVHVVDGDNFLLMGENATAWSGASLADGKDAAK